MRPFFMMKTSVGLDIGTHSIKLVELKNSLKGVILTNFVVKDLPPEAREEKRSVEVLAKFIKEIFVEENINPQKVTIAVSGPRVVIRHITVPLMPKNELKEAVKWQTKKLIPFPLDRAVLDFQLLGEIVSEGTSKFDIVVAAADRELVENQLAIIKEAGLTPGGISTISNALWHSFQKIPEAGKELTAIIDIGATKTSINILKDNRLKFTREISTAGNSFTNAIEEAATLEGNSLDFEEAEEIKKEYGIPKPDNEKVKDNNITLQKISFGMRPVLERILLEINQSFEFYNGQFKEEKLKKIFLSGGGARLKGLKEYLTDQLGIEIELLIPFKDMTSNFAIATGLAMGKAEEINLLPEEYSLGTRMLLQIRAPVVFACLVFILLSFLYIKMNVTSEKYRKDLSLKEKKLALLQSDSIRLFQLEENRKRLKKEKALISKVVLDQPFWGEILKEISHIIPAETTLTALSFRTKEAEKEIQLEGVAFGEDSEIVKSIIEIIEGMEKSPFFSDIQLFSSRENNEYNKQGANFEFVCRIQDTRYRI